MPNEITEMCTDCKELSLDVLIHEGALQVWDAALRAVCQARGVQSMPSFVHLMRLSVGGLARKPVRARYGIDVPEAPPDQHPCPPCSLPHGGCGQVSP